MSEKELDDLLSLHVRERLEPQVGRAQVAFEREVRSGRRLRLWITAASAMAAGIAVAWMIMARMNAASPAVLPQIAGTEPQPLVPMVQAATWTGMKDEGIARFSGIPVRTMRREILEEVEWYDPNNKALVRTQMPRQQVFLIGLKTD